MKKLLILLAVLLISAFIITSCSSGASSTPTLSTTAPVTTQPATSTSAPATNPVTTKPASTTPTTTTPVSSTPSASPSSNKYGGTLRYITAAGPGAPIGASWMSNGTSSFFEQFSQQFLLKEQLDGSFVPNLAESYDVVTDPANPSITFHLRKGVKFSDGTDFNAKAVQWNLQMAMAPTSQAVASTTQWKSIDVLDDYTVRVNLKSFTNLLVRGFADTVSFMASPTAYQKNGDQGSQWNPVGTGPFNQKDFQRDVSMTVTKNPNYWEVGKPYLDGMQFLFVGDSMTANALFKSGGGEVLAANAQVASELRSMGYKVITIFSNGSVLVPDSKNADSPWANLKVRQAAEYALDKESLAKTFGFGFMQAAYQYNGSTSPAYDKNLESQYRKYDVAKAKQLLAEAGYPKGFKTTMLCTPYGSNKDMAVAMQAMLAAVGIQADLQFPQASAWSQYQTGTWHNAILYNGLLQYANPNAGWNLGLGLNTLWYQSLKKPDDWPALLTASLNAPKVDPAVSQKAEDALFNDVTMIMLNFSAATWVVTDKVQDTGLGTRGIWGWFEPQNAWLSK